jgi:hypothetical protein
MIRNLKALGLALVAILALGALSASAAMAETGFHSDEAHTILKGSQIGTDTFTVNAGTVKCGQATYEGTTDEKTETTVTVTPNYSECVAFGFVNTTIDVNGCTYEFSSHNNNVVIGCGANPITVTAFNCWVTVGSQTTNGGITYGHTPTAHEVSTTGPRPTDIDVTVNISGIHYTQHSKSFPGCSNGTRTDGKYTGAATVQGFNTANEPVDIWRTTTP